MVKNETKIVPMTYDKVFKSVLISMEARGYLISLISNIIGISKDKIRNNIVFKNNEQSINRIREKRKITDLIVEIKGNVINLEMNKEYYEGLLDRNNEYISKIRESIVKEGQNYDDVPKIIQINFDNYNIYKPDKRVVIKFEMMDEEKNIKEGVNIESYHVILPNAKERYYNGDRSELVKELMIMMVQTDKELEKLIKENLELKEVGEKIKDINGDSDLAYEYDYEEHQRFVRNSMMSSAIRKGWNEGKEDGRKEGILENQKNIVLNMLKENLSMDIIKKITGLSEKQIENIINKN